MRRWGLGAALLMVALALGAPGGQARAAPLDPRTVKSSTLANGLVLVVWEQPAAEVVAVEVMVGVGSADDPPELAGAAHLLEHVCWVSGGEGDPRTRIEARGGSTYAGTLRDYTRYCTTVAAGDFPIAMQALGDMVLRPRLESPVIDRQRRTIMEEVATRRDRPRIWLNDLAFEAVFGGDHPYGRPIEGSEAALAGIQPYELARLHRTWYTPNNMSVVVGGKVTFDGALQEVEKVFGHLRPEALPVRRRGEVARPAAGREVVVTAAGRDAYVMAAFVGPSAAERTEVAAGDVLATMLSYGCLGRLSGELVEVQQVAKRVGVDFLTQRDRAVFGVWAVCDPANVEAVRKGISEELRRVASEPASAAELALARRLVYAGYCFANETPADCTSTLAFYQAVDSYRAATEYPARVGAITAQDITRVASWYAGEPVWVVLMPEGGGE